MKIVFCDFVCALDIDGRMSIYKKCGVEYIQAAWGLDYGQSDENRFRVYECAKSHGIKIEIVHLDKERENLMHKPGPEGDLYVEKVIKTLGECAKIGVKCAIFHPNYGLNAPLFNAKSLSRMRKIVKFCEKANIILAIENLEVNYHLEYYLEKIKSENLKMLFDIGHSNCFTHNTFELFELHRDRIFAAHIHNNHGKHGVDEHNSLDDGNIDFARFFKIPNNIEYCLIEANPKNTKTPQEFEAFVKNNLRILRGFIS